jgi:alkanesulfonate monooxygenase SsuD/methylene tetrahydromethanopterin reductase-like flavin-dependent oxidoreductase (luciferase family)
LVAGQGTGGGFHDEDLERELGHVENASARRAACFSCAGVLPTSEGFIGTPDQVANELIRWFEEGAVDGFVLGLPILGFGLEDFITLVLPALSERGYHDLARQATP